MNIAIFTDTYFPQISGVSTSVRLLKEELTKRGHTVYIFTTSDPDALEEENIFRLPSMPFIFLPARRVALLYPPKLMLKMRSLAIDVIHTQTEFPLGIFGAIAAEFLKVPLVHTYHTMYEDYVHYVANGHIFTPKMAQQYSRIFCNRARAVITPTDKSRDSLLAYGVERPVRVIPTGINFAPFARGRFPQAELDEAKREVGLNLTDPVVVSVGRVAKEKGVDVVVREFPKLLAKLPAAKLLFVGDGPLVPELKAMAQAEGIADSVIFAGQRPWDVIGKYYQLGDVFVSASTSETQGLSYIEAMAAGVVVCAKADKSIDGIVINGKTGCSFIHDEELADMLYAALSDKESREAMIAGAYKNIQPLSGEVFAASAEALYNELLGAYPPPRRRRTRLYQKHVMEYKDGYK